MSSYFQIKHIDRKAINQLVHGLMDFQKDRVIEGALKSAGKVFEAGGKRRLRQRMKSGRHGVTGNLLRSFHVRLKKERLGVLVGFRQGREGGNHSHLVDEGTVRRYWKRNSNRTTGKMPANYFWTDTRAQDYHKAIDKLYAGIEKAVNRISNRQ